MIPVGGEHHQNIIKSTPNGNHAEWLERRKCGHMWRAATHARTNAHMLIRLPPFRPGSGSFIFLLFFLVLIGSLRFSGTLAGVELEKLPNDSRTFRNQIK